MAPPVWVLSVDLQTKTATFQSGLAGAARSARGAFTDIKSGSGEMGREVSGHMSEARHGVMMLGEEFGIHLPRGLTTFIASLGPVGAAMEAAFPFLAIILGATLLLEHLHSMHEAGEKLTEDQMKFGTTVQTAFNSLDQKLTQAGIKADELRGDHLGALHKQLEQIDRQSMEELVHQFAEVAKGADIVFADLKSHWYTFGIGSTGAKHALDEFQGKYDSLLAQGKQGEATDLLKGTRDSAQKVLDAQNLIKNSDSSKRGAGSDAMWAEELKYRNAKAVIDAAGVSTTEKEVAAQQTLVDALNAQAGVEGKVAELKKLNSQNAGREASGEMAANASAKAREAAEAQLRMGEQSVAADRAAANARLAVQHASIQERLQSDIGFADRELELQLASNNAQIAALNKLAKDYPNQLKALQDKALELQQQHDTAVSEAQSKASIEQNAKNLQDIEQGEREKIDATRQGSAERLAAIDAAMKEEREKNMQELAGYKQLLTQRVETLRQMAEEEAKQKETAGREMADNAQKMGELAIQAEREQFALQESARRMSDQQRIAEAIKIANEETAIQMTALSQQIANLDKSGKDYEGKLKQLQDRQTQLTRQHENALTALKDSAEKERNQRTLSAQKTAENEMAQSLSSLITKHQTFSQMLQQYAQQAGAALIHLAIASLDANERTKMSDAGKAARDAFKSAMGAFPPPANLIAAPLAGAAAFETMMGFAEGGIVPGVGRGDIVPAMLEPGEGVIPKKLMDAAKSGDSSASGGNHYHAHIRPTYHLQALDGDGMAKALDKHAVTLQRHVETTLRKFNR